jgi:hypothetical protein
LEAAYDEHNKREFELTRHVSLRQLNPLALLTLKATGSCEVTIPEWLYDLDCPGHYMRRIKTVSISIPSVTGPFTSVNCTLSLLRSSLRKSPFLKEGEYGRAGSEDDRFVDYFGTIQSVTSSGNNDYGMFETNLRDERFLPFEGSGAESTWKLELPASFRQFDYNTISDVILHIRYTARQGGSLLGSKATQYLKDLVSEANEAGLALLFSLQHDFPGEWHKFVVDKQKEKEPNAPAATFNAKVKRDYFPYFTQGRTIPIDAVQVVAIENEILTTATIKSLGTFSTNLEDPDGAGVADLPEDVCNAIGDVFDQFDQDKPNQPIFLMVKYRVEA